MAENTTEVLVGGVVLAAAVAFGIYAAQAAGLRSGGDSYPLHASFRSLEGVSVGTDVRLAGVKVGTVSGVALNPETFRADTTVDVAKTIEIPDDSAIVISSEGLLGGNFVEIVPGGSPFFFEPGDQFTDTQGAVSLISLLLKFVGGGGDSDGASE
ncbi:phospholipid/cholesterol/gamma-HCH transport system substrate-binding protein [Pseudosulfitobacter pseudonitzschiae]|uniref:ABC transporter substrate-binding protein n=1 Tax=Pseudosulfitobacter pseudonitzschiae TaxID=1402135 RepID=A0A073JDA1_9RHOB|nr:outer membrane lipid asymmetry maintenance protein MlaD [Pseudosulfitobacter pseudonitzschiae]KEJ95702.1 ABC transporter substrate-binding protein [Pseudosulfitobacter pseudonitzschiae]QKS08354.1 outer membrane lipid asymmetry maintenance protein MlaD [Pseudosulfitobacter pseudonitzschiae]SHF71450.1 phospholipid/cholesterol/gamma-HCH transport system substrate-binding protein [Pseudosulfitobacter pseudonitzschiae]